MVAGEDDLVCGHVLRLASGEIGHTNGAGRGAFKVPDIDRGAVQADAHVVRGSVQRAVVEVREDDVFHRVAWCGASNEVTHEQAGDRRVAVGEVIAGGFREELQRAFILRRFEQHLGGGWLGLALFSILFGLGHRLQGWDAVIMTGMLGAFWGLLYLSRGNAVTSMVSHAGFNLLEVILAISAAQSV